MSGARHWEQDKEATVYIGNLDERVSDALVWELMLQAGRIVNVHLPKDRVTQTHQGFGFVEFISEEDAEYAARIMNQVRLYGKPIRVNKASADKQKTVEVGAELFVGNLDPMVDEKTLYDTFSTFGNLVAAPKIARDDSGISKGFGFISYDCFEASDKAIESMHNQYLMNKEINVQYAYKKDGKGERHGDQAERLLAAQAKKHNVQVTTHQLPAQLFAPTGPSAASAASSAVVQQQQSNNLSSGGGGGGGGGGGFRSGPPQRQIQNGMSFSHHDAQSHQQHQPQQHHHHHQQQQQQQPHHQQQQQQQFNPPIRGPPQLQHHAPSQYPTHQLAPPPQGLPARPPPPVGFQPHQFAPQMGNLHPGFNAPPPSQQQQPSPQGFGAQQQQQQQQQQFGARAAVPPGFGPPGSGGGGGGGGGFGGVPPPGMGMGLALPPPPPPPGFAGYGRGR